MIFFKFHLIVVPFQDKFKNNLNWQSFSVKKKISVEASLDYKSLKHTKVLRRFTCISFASHRNDLNFNRHIYYVFIVFELNCFSLSVILVFSSIVCQLPNNSHSKKFIFPTIFISILLSIVTHSIPLTRFGLHSVCFLYLSNFVAISIT